MRSWLRKEFLEYRSSIGNQIFTSNDARSCWYNAIICGTFPGLTRLARLILTVPASSIAQERQLSELKRRSWGLRNRLKIEAIERDLVVSSCNASAERVNSSLALISDKIDENLVTQFSKIDTLPFIR